MGNPPLGCFGFFLFFTGEGPCEVMIRRVFRWKTKLSTVPEDMVIHQASHVDQSSFPIQLETDYYYSYILYMA
jgi:hypothetical protein